MKKFKNVPAFAFVLPLFGLVALVFWWSGWTGNVTVTEKSQTAATVTALSSADNFAVLAGSSITNTGSSFINGDLGLSPGSAVTGFPPGIVNGTKHIADQAAVQAKTDLTAAYNSARGQTPVSIVATELGGKILTPGVYNSAAGTFNITGPLTLDAQGNPNAVFIFKTASTLITGGASSVVLTNGAQSCNIFWQVGSSATLGTKSVFKGNILASASVTLATGASIEGRVLAQTGAVTLDNNVITGTKCSGLATTTINAPGTSTPGSSFVPLIGITSVPEPFVLPKGAGNVTYNYAVKNFVQETPMINVQVIDDSCAPVKFTEGDDNGDNKLDYSETWRYTCSVKLSTTTQSIATASGSENGMSATHQAYSTVVVGSKTPAPLVSIVNVTKVASPLSLPKEGGKITFTYRVNNPGVVPLTDVTVSDDKCSAMTGHLGDTNGNNILDMSEVWTYRCTMSLMQTTTSTATVTAFASGLQAIDHATLTVKVATLKAETLIERMKRILNSQKSTP